MYSKKGQVEGVGAVLTLIVGVGVAVLVLIFSGTLSGQVYQLVEPDIKELGHYAESNNTVTLVNGTVTYLKHPYILSYTVTAYNNTNHVLVGAGNYTINNATGLVAQTCNTFNNSAIAFSYGYYNYTIQSSVRESIVSGFKALEQTGNYLPILVLAFIISVVLGLILNMTNISGGGKGNVL